MLWPENTETAFRGAAHLGCRFFETDVRLTCDGALVCFHDSSLERTTNGSGKLASSSLDELRTLDAGYRHNLDGDYPFRGQGVVVPTLEEAITAIPDGCWVIDMKAEGTPEPLAAIIDRLNLSGRVIVGSFSTKLLDRFRELTGGKVPTSTGEAETIRAVAAAMTGRLIDPFRTEACVLQVPETWYGVPVATRALVDMSHAQGRLIHVWTVNDTEDMARLTAMGVDGIITDRPDLLNLR